jgi:hypothetical protein
MTTDVQHRVSDNEAVQLRHIPERHIIKVDHIGRYIP